LVQFETPSMVISVYTVIEYTYSHSILQNWWRVTAE